MMLSKLHQPDSAKVHADLFGDTWIDVKSSGQVYRVPVPPELLTQVIADLLALLSPEQLEGLELIREQRNG
jgi:hypothetical protein